MSERDRKVGRGLVIGETPRRRHFDPHDLIGSAIYWSVLPGLTAVVVGVAFELIDVAGHIRKRSHGSGLNQQNRKSSEAIPDWLARK